MSYAPKVGDIIKMRSWHGIILDVFQNEQKSTVIRVQTVRNLFRKLGPEFIQMDLAPDQITLATREDLEKEITLHQQIQEEAIAQFLALTAVKEAKRTQERLVA